MVSALAAWTLVMGSTACNSATPTASPVLAVIRRVANQVNTVGVGQLTPSPASAGTGLRTGTTLTTADQSSAALDFGMGNGAYLESLTVVTLLRIAAVSQGIAAEMQLRSGRVLAVMPSGSLAISTALGRLDLTNGVALIEYVSSTVGPAADRFTITCLAIGCAVNSRVYTGDLDRHKQINISNSGLTVGQAQLSDAEVAALLDGLTGAGEAAATLTAWPVPTATLSAVSPTSSQAPATPIPSRTLQPTESSPTPQPTATDTSAPTETVTPTPTPSRRPGRSATPSDTPHRHDINPAAAADGSTQRDSARTTSPEATAR